MSNKYKTSGGVELDLTPEQAKQYSKISPLILIGISEIQEPTRVRPVEKTLEIKEQVNE